MTNIYKSFSKVAGAALALGFLSSVIIAPTSVSAMGPARVDTLNVTVVGKEPLMAFSSRAEDLSVSGGKLSAKYSYQHADAIDFEVADASTGTIVHRQFVDTAENNLAGTNVTNIDFEGLPAGEYVLTAKLHSNLGYAEDSISFNYSGKTAILATSSVSAETLSALEKAADASARHNPVKLTETDRIVTSILVGLIFASASAFVLKKYLGDKRRSLISDSSISFLPETPVIIDATA